MNKYKVLGLGSNVGNRKENLLGAIQALEDYGIHITKESSVYETEPVDCRDKDWFLNQVVCIETDLMPYECLMVCKRIEAEMGRAESYRNAPRIIDIDLLLWEELVMDEQDLTIPHMRIYGRKFVLIPLLEVIQDFPVLEWLVSTIHGQNIRKYKE
jgi:2-amino-4-hydroxy-6-hydroxymethyldihydropteridine diphosphokinase